MDLLLIVQELLVIQEFQILMQLCYYACLILLTLLLFVFIAHSAYIVLGTKLMYRKKKPIDGWNKKFYPSLLTLTVFVGGVTWLFVQLSQGVVPFLS